MGRGEKGDMMSRPITLVSGQWADLPFDAFCAKAAAFGYDGVEIACWGDHMDVKAAATDPSYVEAKKAVLAKQGLGAWALSAHLAGQCVGDPWDPRLDGFAPAAVKGKPEAIVAWAAEEMKLAARAARAMGCSVVTCFMGSPIWRYWYSFPQTTEEMISEAYAEIVRRWTPIFDVFDGEGVRFALEVHPTEIAFDYYSAQRLLEAFKGRKTLGFNFDPSHLAWQGMKPELFVRDFAERIYHVHLKDAAVTLDGRAGILGSHLPFGDLRRGWNFRSLGHGDVDFDAIIRELNAARYAGPLSVEWEDGGMEREFGARESLEFARRLDFSPSGFAFDGAMKK
jgi:sugar phosphate isomerase/epimerase